MPLTKETHILVVDDDEDDFFITREYLQEIEGNIVVHWASTYAIGMQEVKNNSAAVYLVDYRLGARTGLDFIRDAIALGCEAPIILLTGKGNPTIDREAMLVGAADYLVKSELNPEKLGRSLRYSITHAGALKLLRANERKYRSMFERSKDAIFIADLSLHLKDVNQGMSDLVGLQIEEVNGQSLYPIIKEGGADIMKMLAEHQDIIDLEVTLLSPAGDDRYCIISATVQRDGNEEPYIQGIIHDITSLKKAEKTMLQVEKQAATSRFIRTLAHEVRNPLSNIQMSVEQLKTQARNEEDELFMDIIQRNSKRINDLITELLDSSRPTEMHMKKINLRDVLDKSIAAALDSITLQRINMKVNFPDKACYIHGDENKLKISFLNIIINAIEAMKEEEGELVILINDMQPYYIVEISDNGCGISEESLAHLFEPYFTSKRNGMGLGLASTLNILQAHNATIDVTSKPKVGTTFSVTLPAEAMKEEPTMESTVNSVGPEV